MSKKVIYIVIIATFLLVITILYNLYAANKENSIYSSIKKYTKNKKELKLTIGIFKEGKTNFKVFGTDGKNLEKLEYDYEIGSISKTFTASILCKAIDEGLIDLNKSISTYLPLDSNEFYPSILSLATHTSGYGEYPFGTADLSEEEIQKMEHDFNEKKINIYKGINKNEVLLKIKSNILKEKEYNWEYSNFGVAVLGTVIEEIYKKPYKVTAENFLKNDLGLNNTKIGNGRGNLKSYWNWNSDDVYIATGGYVSTVTDLLKYGEMHLNNSPKYFELSHKIYKNFKNEEISMGLGWIIDTENNYLWHNGSTSFYQSFIGIDKKSNSVVVVLSNYSEIENGKDEDAVDILGYLLLNKLRDKSINEKNIFNK